MSYNLMHSPCSGQNTSSHRSLKLYKIGAGGVLPLLQQYHTLILDSSFGHDCIAMQPVMESVLKQKEFPPSAARPPGVSVPYKRKCKSNAACPAP